MFIAGSNTIIRESEINPKLQKAFLDLRSPFTR